MEMLTMICWKSCQNQPPARPNQNPNNNIGSLLSTFHESQPTPQQQSSQPQQQPLGLRQGYSGRLAESPGDASAQEQTPINQMSALERFGLPGLLATVRSDNPDVASLAIGQDLTQLGLNLNSPEWVALRQILTFDCISYWPG